MKVKILTLQSKKSYSYRRLRELDDDLDAIECDRMRTRSTGSSSSSYKQ